MNPLHLSPCLLLLCAPCLLAVPLIETRLESFAPVPVAITGPVEPAKPMEQAPPELADATNLDRLLKEALKAQLPPECRGFLAENRCVLLDLEATALASEGDQADEMLAAFDHLAGSEWTDRSWHPRLFTPDVFLHAYHRYFANALEVIEQTRLRPRLEAFLAAAMRNAAELRPQTDAATAARLEWVEAQLATAWIVLGIEKPAPKPKPEDDGAVADEEAVDDDGDQPKCDPRLLAQRLADVRKRCSKPVAEAIGIKRTRCWPRSTTLPAASGLTGHGTRVCSRRMCFCMPITAKTEELRAWFRSMMFLGLHGQTLSAESPRGLTDALLLAQVLARQPGKGPRPLELWRPLMEITTFFAGPSDDLDYPAFRGWVAETLGTTEVKLNAATNPEVLAKLTAALGRLPLPQIVSAPHTTLLSPAEDPPSFRVFGQRFSADAWVFSALTRGSPDEAPAIPTATFVTAAFGDPFSLEQALTVVAAPHLALFEERLEAVRGELAAKPDAAWFGSMAAAQLHAATRLCGNRSANFPRFMQTRAFAAKNAESVLGSWTELKHDTVLYAKQNYAEMGEGGDPAKPPKLPVTRSMVQPDVPFWRALERLATFTNTGFSKHQLLRDAGEEFSTMGRFLQDVRLCRRLAEKEIAGTEITRVEFDALMNLRLGYMDEAIGEWQMGTGERSQTALVTDVFTDASSQQALHQALGRPCVMLALVGDPPHTRVLTGLAYRHYEFARPIDQRMTDEAWRKQVYQPAPQLPSRAKWAAPVFVPEKSGKQPEE